MASHIYTTRGKLGCDVTGLIDSIIVSVSASLLTYINPGLSPALSLIVALPVVARGKNSLWSVSAAKLDSHFHPTRMMRGAAGCSREAKSVS